MCLLRHSQSRASKRQADARRNVASSGDRAHVEQDPCLVAAREDGAISGSRFPSVACRPRLLRSAIDSIRTSSATSSLPRSQRRPRVEATSPSEAPSSGSAALLDRVPDRVPDPLRLAALWQPYSEGQTAKKLRINALRVPAFSCSVLDRILSPGSQGIFLFAFGAPWSW